MTVIAIKIVIGMNLIMMVLKMSADWRILWKIYT